MSISISRFNSGALAGVALAAALLAGCGGSGDDSHGGLLPTGPVAQTITDVVAYINNLIAGSGEASEPADISALTLSTDDTSDPAPLN